MMLQGLQGQRLPCRGLEVLAPIHWSGHRDLSAYSSCLRVSLRVIREFEFSYSCAHASYTSWPLSVLELCRALQLSDGSVHVV